MQDNTQQDDSKFGKCC